jgi:hypothetical protein
MSSKFDGVVDAVRYHGGQIQFVRAYERRGATFSDHVLVPRKNLLEQLKKGRKYFTGRRRELLASTFELDKPLQINTNNGHELIGTRPGASTDELEGVPVL